jgi:hypothetical protein
MSNETALSNKIEELIFWIKFSQWNVFVNTMKTVLRDDNDKLVYELSNGERSTRDIAQLISKSGRKITHVTVSNMWQRWLLVPVVMPSSKKGRFKKVASLKLIGIEVPKCEGIIEEKDGNDE